MSMFGCDWMSRATAAEVLPLERRPEPALLPSSDEAVPVIPNDPCSNTRLHRVLAPILSPHDVRRVVQFALSNVDAPSPRADHRSDSNMLLSVGIAASLGLYGHANVNDIPAASDEDYSAHAYLQDIVRMCLLAETNEISVKEVSEHLMACRAMLAQQDSNTSDITATSETKTVKTNFQLPSLLGVPPTWFGSDMLQNSNVSSKKLPTMQLQHSVCENGAKRPYKILGAFQVQPLATIGPAPTLFLTRNFQDSGTHRVLQLARLSPASSNSDQQHLDQIHIVISVVQTISLALYGHCDLEGITVAYKNDSTVESLLQHIVENNNDTRHDRSHLLRLSLVGEENGGSSDELQSNVNQPTSANASEIHPSSQHDRQPSKPVPPVLSGFEVARYGCPYSTSTDPPTTDLETTSIEFDSDEIDPFSLEGHQGGSSSERKPAASNEELAHALLMKMQALDGMFAPLECPSSILIPSATVVADEIITHATSLVHTMAVIAGIIKAPMRFALLEESAPARFASAFTTVSKISMIFQRFIWICEHVDCTLVPEMMESAMAQIMESADELLSLYETFIDTYDMMLVFLMTSCNASQAEDMLERPLFEIESFIELVVLLVRAGRGPGKSEPPYARAVVAALRRLGTRPIWNDFLLRLRTRYPRRFNAWVFRNGNQVLGKQGDWRLLKRGEVRIKVLPWIWIRYTLYLFDHVLIWTPTRPSTKTAGLMQLFSDLRLGLGGRNHNEVSIISPVSSHTQPASLRFICSSQTEAVMWILRIERATVFRPSSPPEDRTGVCISSSSVVHGPFDRRHNFRVGIDLEWHTDLETIVELQRPIGEGSLGAASLCVFLDTKEPWVVELVEAVDMERLKLILSPFFNGVEGSVECIFGVGGPDPGHSNKFWILKEYIEGGTLQRISEIQPLDMRQIGYLTLGLIKALAAIHSRNLWYGELEFGSILVSCQGTIKLAIPRRFRPDLLKVSYKETRSARRIKKLQEEDIRFIGCVVSNLVSLYRAVLPARDKKPSAKLALWAKFIIYCASSGTTLDILASHPFVLFDEESEAYVRCRLLQMVLNMRSANNFARC